MRYALIDKESHKIKNVIVWDGDESKWKPPQEYDIKPLPIELKFGIDDTYDYEKDEFCMCDKRKGKQDEEIINDSTPDDNS